MDSKHTPGPWRVRLHWTTHRSLKRPEVLGPPHKDGGDYAPICDVDTDANALLIAAAPDLLAACHAVMLWASTPGNHGGNPYCMKHVQACRDALLKADANYKY